MNDLNDLISWNAEWNGLDVVVLGLDPVAFSVVDTLTELGATVRVIADNPPEQYAKLLPVIGASFAKEPGSAHLVIATALTGDDDPTLEWARTNGVPVWGDVELAWRVRDKVKAAEWLCVTGVSDTSAIADLAVHLLASASTRVAGVGHSNVPILDAVRSPDGFDVLVVELTARDLRWAPSVSSLASVCFDGEGELLGRVYANTRIACVYNKAVEATMRMVEEAEVTDGCRAIGFDLGTPGPSDLGMVGDIVVDRAFHESRHREALELTTHGELLAADLGGPDAVARVLAASALVRAVGISPEAVRNGIATFGDTRSA